MKILQLLFFLLISNKLISQGVATDKNNQQKISNNQLGFWDQIVHNIDLKNKGKPKQKTLNDFGLKSFKKREYDHLKKYLVMKRKAKKKADEYLECINKIPNSSFSTNNIELCTGKDFQLLKYDFDYQKRILQSSVARYIRQVIFNECYKKAGKDLQQAESCDIFQRDLLDMLWQDINFYKLLLDNEDKYVSSIVQMDLHVYENLILQIHKVYKELDELIDNLFAQKEQVIYRIKTSIDERTSQIVRNAEQNSNAPKPLIYTHHITIKESLNGPQYDEHPSFFQTKRYKDSLEIPVTTDDIKVPEYGSILTKNVKQKIDKQNEYFHSLLKEYPPQMAKEKTINHFGVEYVPMFGDEQTKKL